MTKIRHLLCGFTLLLVCLSLGTVTVCAGDDLSSEWRQITIATVDNRPASIDRLLYTALKDIDRYADITTTSSLQHGYAMANSGERGGVISSTPNMLELYPNLRQVPFVLDQNIVKAFTLKDDNITIDSWDDLSGLRVGTLTGRVYIDNQMPADATVTATETVKRTFAGLLNNEYDVVVLAVRAHETLTMPDGVVVSGEIESLPEYLYMNQRYEYLIPEITQALKNVFADGRAEKILSDIPIPEAYQKKTILHILSSNMQIAREEQFSSSLKSFFDDDMSIEWYTVELNSKRFSRDETRLMNYVSLLRKECVLRNISAIVVSGDEALDFIKEHYFTFFRNVPVIFYGVNEDYNSAIADYEDYFTGIHEQLPAYETAELALSLFPDTKSIFVVNDFTIEGRFYREAMESQLKPFSKAVSLEYNSNMSCDSLLERIKGLPKDSLVFFGSYFCDSNGLYYPLREMKRLLERDCNVPIFALYGTDTEYNSLGGKSLDYKSCGEIAAGMLMRVLNGDSPAYIEPTIDNTAYSVWVFDKIMLDRWNISVKELPDASLIKNRTISILESDPTLVFSIVVMIVSSLAAIYFVTRLHKQKELRVKDLKIREIKEQLEHIINTAPLAYALSVDGTVVESNEYAKAALNIYPGSDAVSPLNDAEQQKAISDMFITQNTLNDQIFDYKMSDGSVQRFLTSISKTEYDGKRGFILWAMDIEERERQKDQLDLAQKSMQRILDALPLPVGIADGEDYKMLYGNKIYLSMIGCDSLEDLRKIHCADTFSPRQNNGIGWEELITSSIRAAKPLIFEVQMRAKDRDIEMRMHIASINYNGRKSVVGILSDLSREKEYQRMQESLQTVLDALPVAVRILDIESDDILYVNPACMDLYLVPDNHGMDKILVTRFMPEFQPNGVSSREMLAELDKVGAPTSAEMILTKYDGTDFEALLTACLIEFQGKTVSLGIIVDLTVQKEYEAMLKKTADKEKEANQLKGRFLVNMSHEIRTPMNAIIGLTEIEMHKGVPKDVNDVYKKINISAKNLLEIINDILDLSKIEADKIELFEDEFELEEVLNSALLVATPRLEGKNVEFLLNASLDLPRCIVGDKTRLWQILKNFLDNSAKYTEKGKIVLSAYVDDSCSNEQTVGITFVIEDTGIGISETQMHKLFQPYEQIKNDAQKRYSGTGLGLAISKQLCEIMGGTLEVNSEAGKGTKIVFTIPFTRSQNTNTEMEAVALPELAGIKALAVDDDQLSLDIMQRLLESGNASCELAKSGEEALDILLERRNSGQSFDVILLDYMMDGLNGLETAKRIHLALSKAPKLLMVTAYQKVLLKQELDENGIDDTIEKPFIPSQFIHKLCVTLGLTKETNESRHEFTMFKDVNILLCEDYRLNQEVASGMIAQFGITADIAENGQQCIDMLNGNKQYDLIFMDLQMPVMDGYEATRIIRSNPKYNRIPIVSLTADAMKEVVDKCLEIGMDDHVPKPIEFSSLHRVFLKWLPESKRVSGDSPVIPAVGNDADNEVLARFGGNKERYEQALKDFIRLFPAEWEDFDSAVQNTEETMRYMHKLKGAAGNLAEKDIFIYSSEFEASLKSGKPNRKLYDKLIDACGKSTARILSLEDEHDGTAGEAGTEEEFNGQILTLKNALENFDPVASSAVMKSLKEKAWPSADGQILRQIYDAVKKYDFDKALDLLKSTWSESK